MRRVLRGLASVVLLCVLSVTLSSVGAAEKPKRPAVKFVPPAGKTLVAIGGSRAIGIERYRQATGHIPQGMKLYCGLKTEGDATHFRNNASENKGSGQFLVVEYALDPAFPRESPKNADKLGPFLRGEMDNGIRLMGQAVKKYGHPVFAAIGYEFDGQHPHQAREYAAVFRRIHDAWSRLGVTNVAYVWHTYTDNVCNPDSKVNKTEAELYEHYPGDRYVDWFGVSIYYETQRQGAIRFAQMARSRRKPVAIVESGVGINPNKFWDYSWLGCYAPLFATIDQLDIKLLCYNNFGDDFNQFSEPCNPFRNSQMDRMPRQVREGWARVMRTTRYRGASVIIGEGSNSEKLVIGPSPSRSGMPFPPAKGKAINLLLKVNPERDAIVGDWKLTNKVLTFAGDREWSRLQLPYRPPEEYDLTVVTERVRGSEILVIGLVIGGRQAMVLLDGWGGGISGLEQINGKASGDNETTHRGWRFVNGTPTTIVCQVRRDAVSVTCNGTEVINWKGAPSRLSLVKGWQVPEHGYLFLGGWKGGAFRIRKIELKESSLDSGGTDARAASPAVVPRP